MTPNIWRTHAHELARAFRVALVEQDQRPPEQAFAIASHNVVIVAPIFDETTYAVALHELGHCVAALGNLANQTGDRWNLRRVEEDAAWEWAKHYAREWTPLMEKVAVWARASYDVPAPPPEPPAPVAPIRQQIDWEDWK